MNHTIKIRIEETFVQSGIKINCGVIEKENIIIDPKGRLFGCTMFLDMVEMQTANFENNTFVYNKSGINESTMCKKNCNGCPAIEIINNSLVIEAAKLGYSIDCIFNKTIYQ